MFRPRPLLTANSPPRAGLPHNTTGETKTKHDMIAVYSRIPGTYISQYGPT